MQAALSILIAVGLLVCVPETTQDIVSIEQALSDTAQRKTIAFSGLAFLTGNLCSYTFFPPGKVSDFFGFQYHRDTTPNHFGHNTEFAGKLSECILAILTSAQVQQLVDMANTQAHLVEEYGYKRFVLIKAFRRLLENDLPEGAVGLDKDAVKEFAADLYQIDAEISYTRASVLGGIIAELTDAQKTNLTNLHEEFNALFESAGEGGSISENDWPAAEEVDYLSDLNVTDGKTLVGTYADQLFSWYLGSVEGDTYFCPERHGTYFGSFYMKDIPPVSSPTPVTIDTELTANLGTAFLDTLNDDQAALINSIVDLQRSDMENIVAKRQETSETLRRFINGSSVSEASVVSLVRDYGESEGAMMFHYATNYAAVGNSLNDTQNSTLMDLRISYYSQFPEYQANSSAYHCSGAWLYARKIDMPDIPDTDFLFTSETTTSTTTTAASTTTTAATTKAGTPGVPKGPTGSDRPPTPTPTN